MKYCAYKLLMHMNDNLVDFPVTINAELTGLRLLDITTLSTLPSYIPIFPKKKITTKYYFTRILYVLSYFDLKYKVAYFYCKTVNGGENFCH